MGQFHKMHGLGNDFVIIDTREQDLEMVPTLAAAIADRHTGIGCDQLIIIQSSITADVKMQIFNANGGEVESCGNATRCISMLLGDTTTIETKGGNITGEASDNGATVDMGKPVMAWDAIPLAYAMDTLNMPIGWEELQNPVTINVGNPHVVFFVQDSDDIELERLGPIIEHDPLFPNRVNVNVASIDGDIIKLRVWERGAGLTRACGTGACASAVAAIKKGLVSSPVQVELPGGTITISWIEGGSIKMDGPAIHVFSGTADWNRFK